MSEGDPGLSSWQRGLSRVWQSRAHFREELEFLEGRTSRKGTCPGGQSSPGQEQGNE